jgi:hypothetical protein
MLWFAKGGRAALTARAAATASVDVASPGLDLRLQKMEVSERASVSSVSYTHYTWRAL